MLNSCRIFEFPEFLWSLTFLRRVIWFLIQADMENIKYNHSIRISYSTYYWGKKYIHVFLPQAYQCITRSQNANNVKWSAHSIFFKIVTIRTVKNIYASTSGICRLMTYLHAWDNSHDGDVNLQLLIMKLEIWTL